MIEEQRCPDCNTKMCSYSYVHNGQSKVGYRCPSPHGLRNNGKKDFTMLEFPKIEELPDEFQ